MCTACSELIKAIDAYIAKADEKLSDALEKEGFADPENTVKHMEKLEEQLAETFTEQSADFTDLINNAKESGIDVEEVINNKLPGFKANDKTRDKLFKIFFGDFSAYIPALSNIYMSQLDSELVVNQISQKTTGWITQWSSELSDLMHLSSHKELEDILVNGLKNGKGIDDISRDILENGIRDEYYKARRAALTETLRAHSFAREESIQQCPAAEFKEWVHTGSYRNKPRENHVAMNGQIVPKDKNFRLRGANGITYLADFPRDPFLPPGESVNCHCIHRGVVSQEILGLSLEERKRLQQQAIEEMDETWLKEIDEENKKKAGIEVDNPDKSGIIKTEIEKGNIKLEINHEKQARHIKGTPEYKEGRSYLTITEDEAQDIINQKYGTGNIHVSNNGQIKEVIVHETDIGINIDKTSHKEEATNAATIHYSKTGTHLVPTKRREQYD